MSRKTTMDQLCVCLAAWMLLLCGQAHAAEVKLAPSEWGIEEGKECVKCHTKTSAGLAEQWRQSRHAEVGMNCLDCHQTDASNVDAIYHEVFTIATIFSPKDCGRCHVVETEQNSSSKLNPINWALALFDWIDSWNEQPARVRDKRTWVNIAVRARKA